MYAKNPSDFSTITCLNCTPVLEEDRFKDSINESLSYAFVRMNNHFHLLRQMLGDHTREAIQRDFLKYTRQQILKTLVGENSPIAGQLLVNAKDRRYQVWQRNSLSISVWTNEVIEQKLDLKSFQSNKSRVM